MTTHDRQGRPYLKWEDVKEGVMVEPDSGVTCVDIRGVAIRKDDRKPWIPCIYGKHYLEGHLNKDAVCVGFYKLGDPDK